eukprot:1237403-Prymnesium_polylepis.1
MLSKCQRIHGCNAKGCNADDDGRTSVTDTLVAGPHQWAHGWARRWARKRMRKSQMGLHELGENPADTMTVVKWVQQRAAHKQSASFHPLGLWMEIPGKAP